MWKRLLWSKDAKLKNFGLDTQLYRIIWQKPVSGHPLETSITKVKHGGGSMVAWSLGCFSE